MSGIFENVPIDCIVVGERRRVDNGDIDELARDIAANDLVQPIVVTKDRELVAGYRRYQACKQLGWTHIPCHVFEDLTEARKKLVIEFAENEKRKSFEWEERAKLI